MKRIILFSFLYLSALISMSQNDWELLNPYPTINSLMGDYFISSQEGWVVGYEGLILHTTNGGYDWETQHSDPDESLSGIFFIDDTEGWTVGWSSIYHTTDAGVTWEKQVKPNWPGDLYDVFFINHDTGWIVGAYKIIFKTTNGGENWYRIMSNLDEERWFYSVDFGDELHGCAVGGSLSGDEGILMVTDDGGENWTEVTPPGAKTLHKVSFMNSSTVWACGSGGQLYKSEDAGATWTSHQLATTERYVDIHFFDELKGALLMNHEIRLTQDGGETWDSLVTIDFNSSVSSFASGTYNHLVAVGYAGYITKSVNGGTTWIDLTNSIRSPIYQIGFFNESDGFAVTGYFNAVGFIRTSDGGYNWEEDTTIENGPFYQMQIKGQSGFFLNNTSQMMKTVDGGETWTLYDVPDLTSYYYDIQFANDLTGYLCGSNSLLVKTNDGGLTWQQITFEQNYKFTFMFFINENTGWLIDWDNRHLVWTTNGGEDWDAVRLIESNYIFKPHTIFFINEQIGFVTTAEGVLFKTTDGGNSWEQFYVFTGSEIQTSRVYFVNEEEGWYTNGYRVYHTLDGGETWINPQSFGFSHIKNMFFLENGQGWLCGEYGLVAGCNLSLDINEDQETKAMLHISPNPANRVIQVSLPGNKVKIEAASIFNMMGQEVARFDNINATGSYRMDISHLSSGTYILKVSSPEGNRLGKFVVQ